MQPGVRVSKRMLEEQLRSQMQNLWADVQEAERGTMEGEEGALERFVESAGLLIENYRMDRSNFTKNRVSCVDIGKSQLAGLMICAGHGESA